MTHKLKKPERRPGNRGDGAVMNQNKEKVRDVQYKHVKNRKDLKKYPNNTV